MSAMKLIAEALHTKRQHGVGLARQVAEATRLRWSPTRLDPWEYYFFRVFLDRYPMREKRCFIGWRREIELDRLLNPGSARDLANDKLRFHAFMHQHGVPIPRLAATWRADDAEVPGGLRLRDADGVMHYLASTDDYPLFAKPARGAHGRRAYSLTAAAGDRVLLASGESLPVASLLAELADDAPRGVLFQERLRTHDTVAAICGDRLTSVRAVVYREREQPRILSAVWRAPTGANVIDNFGCGFTRNLIGAVDLATGEVSNVIQGNDWRNLRAHRHPDIGRSFAGFRLPSWGDLRDLCLDCAGYLPDLRLQHWDIAVTDRGPVVLELNVEGGLRTHQVVAEGPGKLATLAAVRR